ncbi:MAG: Z1 domain-containing protein, partial [Candidatus Pacearchaeota archaeon]|nr:Z1 domain-containing protein [Candidatus Pacearchaeota archaeon]
MPSTLGAFDWNRLTGEDDDYQRLKRGIEALEFDARTKGRRFNDPINLHHWPARIVVMKKLPSIINKLNDDLDLLRTELEEVPALIIDDESDQASVTTRPPTADEKERRTSTNKAIVRLIRALPRAQYVGYTATPFANVFVDPTDTEDIFPKDYIVSLHRPQGYMGVSDFFDLADDGLDLSEDERPKGFESNERAFLRDVYGDDIEDSNLPQAIELFILSGAVKLYRHQQGIPVSVKHHTMLVHRSVKQKDHEDDYELVRQIYDNLGVGTKRFYDRLHTLWNDDVKPVSSCKSPELPMPERFADLKPFIDKCLSIIQQSGHPVRVVNGDRTYEKLMPNFDRDSIWGVLVGGTKLSRGYTVEGLTISYYRRRIKQADTLMQVGRWFGFRRGCSDLVRVYLGREEPDGKNRTFDLKEAFKSICRDEEMFRKELRKYTDEDIRPPILPKDIPPLVPSHMLRPTSPNKMYNVDVKFQNFGGDWKERVHTANKSGLRKNNASLIHDLVANGKLDQLHIGYTDPDNGKGIQWKGYAITISHTEMLDYLEKYQWIDEKKLMQREIEFLRGEGEEDPEIDKWLIIFPQKSSSADLCWNTGIDLSVFRRARVASGAFRVFSERRHRLAARYLAGIENPENPS